MVTSVTSATTQAAAAQTSPSTQGTSLASDFETFLKMLTAQAKYQDPLNPLDSAEYASQLAQFSSVEQSVRTNELLEQIAGQSGANDLTAMASWIGREVLSPAPRHFSGAPLSLVGAANDGATTAEVVALDLDGEEVLRTAIDPEQAEFIWDGLDEAGAPLPDATYSFRIERYSGETLLSNNAAESYVPVIEVRAVSGQPQLMLEGGVFASLENITAVR